MLNSTKIVLEITLHILTNYKVLQTNPTATFCIAWRNNGVLEGDFRYVLVMNTTSVNPVSRANQKKKGDKTYDLLHKIWMGSLQIGQIWLTNWTTTFILIRNLHVIDFRVMDLSFCCFTDDTIKWEWVTVMIITVITFITD